MTGVGPVSTIGATSRMFTSVDSRNTGALEQGAGHFLEFVSSSNGCKRPTVVALRSGEGTGAKVESLEQQVGRALAENERLRNNWKSTAGQQAKCAPFSKGDPKANPKTPGRQARSAYGQRRHDRFPAGWIANPRSAAPPANTVRTGHLNSTHPSVSEDIVRGPLSVALTWRWDLCLLWRRQRRAAHPLQTFRFPALSRVQVDRKPCRWRRCPIRNWAVARADGAGAGTGLWG